MDLPSGVTVFERGWLSANNILMTGSGPASLVDSGYCTHAEQTVSMVKRALAGRPLQNLINTHLHSDHCGGNAALQAEFSSLQTWIPPGQADQVRRWDPVALTYVPTGQNCPRFGITHILMPGREVVLGEQTWQVHAAPGHDPHSVILFEPQSRTLISADALWESGFGVVFPELEGDDAFAEVGATLDLIEQLGPAIIVPGHGRVFCGVAAALAVARRRLNGFVASPPKHALHAAKVLLKFKLLELQRLRLADFAQWAQVTPYFGLVHQRWFAKMPVEQWVEQLAADLERSGAARREGDWIVNT
ncbi:MAG: MBL fold metallo-hydrolase [Ramlibacter sp.]